MFSPFYPILYSSYRGWLNQIFNYRLIKEKNKSLFWAKFWFRFLAFCLSQIRFLPCYAEEDKQKQSYILNELKSGKKYWIHRDSNLQ
jgi:hypothetical protein